MSDRDVQLAFLRAQRDATSDPATRAMFDTLIAEKEAATPSSVRTHTQHIREYTSIQAAIAGDVHGDIYIVGERAESTRALLAGYLRWLASQCGQLPLRGVREQKAATDVLNIGLDQVYTQLATTELVQREVYEDETLKRLDAKAYLEQHVGAWMLPSQQRLYLQRPKTADEQFFSMIDTLKARERRRLGSEIADVSREEPDAHRTAPLESLPPDTLMNILQGVSWLAFYGPQLVTEAIANSARLVLLGEPGSGKSTALRYLALTLARAGLDATLDLAGRLEGWQALGEQGRLIPLFMPLLPLAQRLAAQPGRNGTAADLWTAIDTHLLDHGATNHLVTAIRAELARGYVLLLLDGLDEVAGDTSRRQVADMVQAFAAEQPQCRLVVACRVRAYEGEQNAAWQLPGWPTATLADWTPGQVRAFISAWYAAAATASHMPAVKHDERVAALQRAVAEREDLKRLSIRPLLLTIMALVHLNDGRLPEDRVALYSRCLDILLGQWEIAGKDETVYGTLMQYVGLPDMDVKSLRPLLARVAYAAHQAATPGEVGRLRRADLRELLADALEQLKHPNPHEGAKRFLEYTDVRAGLLQATEAGDAYAFPHQTFQEYLAGLELISGVGFVDQIMERRDEDRWRVPILLGIGHAVSEGLLSAPYQLLSRLLHMSKRDETERQRDLIFAAEIAEDVGWDRLERGGDEFSALRAELAQALAQVVEGKALPAAERVWAGTLLGRLGDPRPGVCTLPPAMVRIVGQLQRTSKLTVPSFEIARYPVTNAQFALFITDDGYDLDQKWWDSPGQLWIGRKLRECPSYWTDDRFGNAWPNHPVVGVSWYEAAAFCRWLTQHRIYNPDGYVYILPSEAIWEFAAHGNKLRTYPWGSEEPDGERANFGRIYGGTTAVGCFSLGATPAGIYDLAGNIWEWTSSVYTRGSYAQTDTWKELKNPASKQLTVRGSCWLNSLTSLQASYRSNYPPSENSRIVGFRLARYLP